MVHHVSGHWACSLDYRVCEGEGGWGGVLEGGGAKGEMSERECVRKWHWRWRSARPVEPDPKLHFAFKEQEKTPFPAARVFLCLPALRLGQCAYRQTHLHSAAAFVLTWERELTWLGQISKPLKWHFLFSLGPLCACLRECVSMLGSVL